MDVKFNQATSAYNNIAKIAENVTSTDDAPEGASFSDMLGDAVNKAVETGYKAESVSTKAMVDKAELGDLVTAVADMELTLNTVVAIRDRVISAYQDIIKMPI
jgi:flagellar hook-basal body complex protein FliE